MEIVTTITTDNLLNIMKEHKGNIKTFSEDIEEDYYLFEKIINILLSFGYDVTDILNEINVRALFITTEQEKNELSENDFIFYKLDNNKYLTIEK